ncbi:MAG: hypothetical protein ACR2QW_02200, partial [bacterium]
EKPDVSVIPIVGVFFLTLLLSVSVVSWLFPNFMSEVGTFAIRDGFKSIGAGLICLLLVPPIALLLLISVIGIPIGLALLAVYLITLFLGLLASIYLVSDLLLKVMGKHTMTTAGWRFLAAALAIIAVMAIQFIPVLGSLGFFVLFLIGLGAVVMQLYSRYRVV